MSERPSSSSPSTASSRSMPSVPTRCSPAPGRRPLLGGAAATGFRCLAAAPSGPRAGWSWAPRRCPTPASASTPWSCRRAGVQGGRDEELLAWVRAAAAGAAGWPPCARAPSSAPRPGCSTAAGSPPTGPGRPQLPADYPALDVDPDPIYIRDGKYWSSAGVTAGIDLALALVAGRSRRRGGPDRRPLAGHVPAPARRADPVRLAGLGAPGRALDRPGRADPRRVGARRRPPAAGPRRRRRHERPPLHPRLHGRGGRDPEPLRRAHPAGGRPRELEDDRRHARRRGGALRPRQRRDPAARLPAPPRRGPDAYRRRFRAAPNERTSA